MKKTYTVALMVLTLLFAAGETGYGQGSVPAGINYQAVARDNNGKEVINTDIEVRFSIREASPLGTIVYQEVHNDVTTSKYGVFSLVIGKGTWVSGTAATFADIDWSTANHYLQVEVKFENIFMDMGTMQFMAVPYALYAGKSLEPGPEGPAGDKGDKGDPGDPATDDQTLTYNRSTRELSISGGNTVTLDTEVAFRARNTTSDVAAINTDVVMTFDTPDLNIGGSFNPGTGVFTVPADGIYTFNITYLANGDLGDGRKVSLYVNAAPYEVIATSIINGTQIYVRSVTARLNAGDLVTMVIATGLSQQTGTGSFSGYKVN